MHLYQIGNNIASGAGAYEHAFDKVRGRDVFSVKDCGLNFTCLALVSPVPDMNSNSPMSAYTRGMWGKNYASSPTSRYMNFKDIAKIKSSVNN